MIVKGDIVEYSENRTDPNNRNKSMKVCMQGIWDGEKVTFIEDGLKTIVRNMDWLIKVEKI